LQFQLKDLAIFYRDRNDIQQQEFSRGEEKGSRRERGRERERNGEKRERRDRNDRNERGGKPRRRNEDMVRFFFNLGKKDQLKKMDMLEIINKATSKSKKRADIGEIEILDKFSFFEIEKSFKNEVLDGLTTMKFRGKEMRAEVAN